jgi:hypothetical protein
LLHQKFWQTIIKPMSNIMSLVFTASLLAAAPGRVNATTLTPDLSRITDSQSWKVTDATAEALIVDGKQAAHLQAAGDSANGNVGMALANGSQFSTGAIELDLKGRSARQRCFLGVVFNVSDTKTFEGVYFRPFNFRTNAPYRLHAVQYIAWPLYTWEHLRKNKPDQFEKPIIPPPDPDDWFHARIEVTDQQVRVFVDHAREPSLTVSRLAKGGVKRPVGLFVDSHDGLYANLQVTPAGPNGP